MLKLVPRRRFLLPLLLIPLRCSSSPHDCAVRTGPYHATFVEKASTCGTFAPVTVAMNNSSTTMAGECTANEESPTTDNCGSFIRGSCPAGPGFSLLFGGSVTWNQDGSKGTGAVIVDLVNQASGTYDCTSTYDVVYTR